MDSNNDSGSDKSLQKKCVVDDFGQGEGASCKATTSSNAQLNSCDGQQQQEQQRPCNSMKRQKTEKQAVGDGGGSEVRNMISIQNANQPAALQNETTEIRDRNAHIITNANASSSTSPTSSLSSSNSNVTAVNCSKQFNTTNNAFETKVKQISKNLKETTLAETENTNQENLTDDSTISSTASNATSPECSEAAALTNDNAEEQIGDIDGTPLNTSMISDSNDDADNRSKKVRFHPDVKENDGGNRVLSKKKKKSNTSTGSDDPTCSQQQTGADDEMDLDEDDDYEEEDEFNLAKTIAEAQDYLKEHPLTFVRPCDRSAGRLQNGLLEEADLPLVNEASEEEEYRDEVVPENGIDRILGKQTKGGRMEFLLRFTNQPGLFWESEDFVATQCPSLLTQYEHNRDRRQDRLMRHVSKRQNLRQRYTDF